MVILEAMALGRPVISTSIAGIPELVEPGHQRLVGPGRRGRAAGRCDGRGPDGRHGQLEAMGRAGAARVAERHNVDDRGQETRRADRRNRPRSPAKGRRYPLRPCPGRPLSGRKTSGSGEDMSDLGIVTIGRNEGERLRRCLNSVAGAACRGLRGFGLGRRQRRAARSHGGGSCRAGHVASVHGGPGSQRWFRATGTDRSGGRIRPGRRRRL